jgi:hypothetical protein
LLPSKMNTSLRLHWLSNICMGWERKRTAQLLRSTWTPWLKTSLSTIQRRASI